MKAIEIANLSFSYPDGTQALKDISVAIEAGRTLGILGPNGAGKSTLLLHLNGILRGEGQIRIDGIDISEDNLRVIRRRVGLVFQDPDDQLFLASVYDDVAFGPINLGLGKEAVSEAVTHALKEVGMERFAHKAAYHLSFGQKKLVALATVLAMSPTTMVLDEPSSNLDPRARREMIGLLRTIKATKIISTHDMDLAWSLCEDVVIMQDGGIVASGLTSEIMINERLLLDTGLECPLAAKYGFNTRTERK